MKIRRFYENAWNDLLRPGKVLVICGPRRAGKTTLLQSLLAGYSGKYFFGSGEDSAVREVFDSGNAELVRSAFAGYALVVIDEAQAINEVGRGLKLLADHAPETCIVASGSSSFDLANAVGEPPTGRKITRTLFPLAATELSAQFGNMVLRQRLDELLVYGMYPEIFTTENLRDKAELLGELRDAYLFKDILAYERIRNADKLRRLVILLAFQVGKEVSQNELSRALGLSVQTIDRYLDLLEKTFVLFKISGFSRNLRSEVTKTRRYYFWDNGILNAVVNNFNPLSLRSGEDVGALWENFLVSERIKRQHYHRIPANGYFWRTYARQEIDRVEECAGTLSAFEFKRNARKKIRPPEAWTNAYPDAEFSVVDQTNFTDFIC